MDRVIVDGYNLLHADVRYSALAGSDIDAARTRLVGDLAGFAQNGSRVIVVFDGGGNPGSDGSPHQLGRLTVIFSPSGQAADAVIEGLAVRFRERGEPVLVVTSDSVVRATVRSGSVSVRSAEAFAAELADARAEARDVVGGSRRIPLTERLPDEIRETLQRWSRG